MASGGRDGYDTGDELDLSGIKEDLVALDRTTDSDQSDSTSQAEPVGTHALVNGVGTDFQGFEEDTSHTAHIQQVIESLSAPQAGSASLPTSPIRVTPGFVQSRVSSLDSLATSSRTGSLSLLTAQPTGQASNSPSLTTQASSQSARRARPSVSASRRGTQRARSASAAPRHTRQSVYQSLRSPPQEL